MKPHRKIAGSEVSALHPQWKRWSKAERVQWLTNQIAFLSNKPGADSLDAYWSRIYSSKLQSLLRRK